MKQGVPLRDEGVRRHGSGDVRYVVEMQFLPDSQPRERRHGGSSALARLLLACCFCGVAATAFPWTYVSATRWVQEVAGPIGARTNAGFTCVATCMLTGLLVLSEGRSRHSREAVRTACVVLMGAACLVLVAQWLAVKATFRGADAERSAWFFAAAGSVALGLDASRRRLQKRAKVSGDAS